MLILLPICSGVSCCAVPDRIPNFHAKKNMLCRAVPLWFVPCQIILTCHAVPNVSMCHFQKRKQPWASPIFFRGFQKVQGPFSHKRKKQPWACPVVIRCFQRKKNNSGILENWNTTKLQTKISTSEIVLPQMLTRSRLVGNKPPDHFLVLLFDDVLHVPKTYNVCCCFSAY